MKNRLITGIIFILLGVLIAFGPQTIFPVCGAQKTEPAPMSAAETTSGQSDMKMGVQDAVPAAEKNNSDSVMSMSSGMVMKCHWTARAELGIGILIALLGVLLIIFKSRQIRMGLSLSLTLNGILALLIPIVLIGVCGNAHMTCHSLTLPALAILSGIVTAVSAVNAAYLYNSNRKEVVGS